MNDSQVKYISIKKLKCTFKWNKYTILYCSSSLQYYIPFSFLSLFFLLFPSFDLHTLQFAWYPYPCVLVCLSILFCSYHSICFLLTKIIYFNKVRGRREKRFGEQEKLIFLLFPISTISLFSNFVCKVTQNSCYNVKQNGYKHLYHGRVEYKKLHCMF